VQGSIGLKMDNILIKTQHSIIPRFHYFYPVKLFSYFTGAMIEAKSQAPKTPHIFNQL
jgi:hypothetical protein